MTIISVTVDEEVRGVSEEDWSNGRMWVFTDYGELHRSREALVDDNYPMIIWFLIIDSLWCGHPTLIDDKNKYHTDAETQWPGGETNKNK